MIDPTMGLWLMSFLTSFFFFFFWGGGGGVSVHDHAYMKNRIISEGSCDTKN